MKGSTVAAKSFEIAVTFGGIAQLGERLHGMQEVSGSIPLTSTNLSGRFNEFFSQAFAQAVT